MRPGRHPRLAAIADDALVQWRSQGWRNAKENLSNAGRIIELADEAITLLIASESGPRIFWRRGRNFLVGLPASGNVSARPCCGELMRSSHSAA